MNLYVIGTILTSTCFGENVIQLDGGGRIVVTNLPKGFKSNDRVKINTVDINGSTSFNVEHFRTV